MAEKSAGPTGVLMTNLGTPDSCEAADIRKFLKQFLSDPRVVRLPRILWLPILNGIILNTRPRRSAEAYKKIWTKDGSPLLAISRKLHEKLKAPGDAEPGGVRFSLGMRYGAPSIESGLNDLRRAGCEKFVILPMYPQYSRTTTASAKDAVLSVFQSWGFEPDFSMICDYHKNEQYIGALKQSVTGHRDRHGAAEKLVMSFHGIPRKYSDDGDPYKAQCETTAERLAAALALDNSQWMLTFQSRFGPRKWLEPYTDKVLLALAGRGVKSVDVICPGFSVDCLETLEEIAVENRETFLRAGGRTYRYIPCLNDSAPHLKMIRGLISEHLG